MDAEQIREAIAKADAEEAARLRAWFNKGDPDELPTPPPAVSPAP